MTKPKPVTDAEPAVYLSFSEGQYRVILHGMPVCADKRTAEEALRVAIQFKLKVSDRMWDGDAGAFVPMTFTIEVKP